MHRFLTPILFLFILMDAAILLGVWKLNGGCEAAPAPVAALPSLDATPLPSRPAATATPAPDWQPKNTVTVTGYVTGIFHVDGRAIDRMWTKTGIVVNEDEANPIYMEFGLTSSLVEATRLRMLDELTEAKKNRTPVTLEYIRKDGEWRLFRLR